MLHAGNVHSRRPVGRVEGMWSCLLGPWFAQTRARLLEAPTWATPSALLYLEDRAHDRQATRGQHSCVSCLACADSADEL